VAAFRARLDRQEMGRECDRGRMTLALARARTKVTIGDRRPSQSSRQQHGVEHGGPSPAASAASSAASTPNRLLEQRRQVDEPAQALPNRGRRRGRKRLKR